MKSFIGQSIQKREKGQILVILALIFIALIGIIGLAIDSGYLYVSYSRLRRAVDAAALGATTQFKKNVAPIVLQKAAREFLVLNGVSDSALTTSVDTCATAPGDPDLCPQAGKMARKLVRVRAKEDVPLFFISILPGAPHSVPIEVSSISEAASIDLVLVIDRSESMGIFDSPAATTEWPKPSFNRDPVSCNSSHPTSAEVPTNGGAPGLWTGNCHPFHEVKSAAFSFIDTFLDPTYDRVAIVVFDHEAYPINWNTPAAPQYMNNLYTPIVDAIRHLWMYDGFHNSGSNRDDRNPLVYDSSTQGMTCPYVQGAPIVPGVPTCRLLNAAGEYFYLDCEGYHGSVLNGTNCGTTNIGRGLQWASYILSAEGRKEGALWVTILLTDGVPNAGFDSHDPPNPICPASERTRNPFCRDTNALPTARHASGDALYDTDDYARDQADALASGSVIFAIGLGDQVTNDTFADPGTPPAGSTLLNYIADVGNTTNYYQAGANDLQKIFLAIANKIATRLTQ
jgi:hypothetical protein